MVCGATGESGGSREGPVLVIDDDPDQRTALAELLSERGYSVVLARDGQEALELLQGGLCPRVIVLDLTMPRMDGWTFLAHLRGAACSDVPVLVTSAVARERPPAGADACIEKPVEAAHFRATVARLSSGARRDEVPAP